MSLSPEWAGMTGLGSCPMVPPIQQIQKACTPEMWSSRLSLEASNYSSISQSVWLMKNSLPDKHHHVQASSSLSKLYKHVHVCTHEASNCWLSLLLAIFAVMEKHMHDCKVVVVAATHHHEYVHEYMSFCHSAGGLGGAAGGCRGGCRYHFCIMQHSISPRAVH